MTMARPAATATHQAIVITAAGGPKVLQLRTLAVPQPTEGEVLIRVAAAGVNRHDVNQRRRGPQHHPNPVPGLEVSGTIISVGPGVAASRLGGRVVALTDGGGYAEHVVAPAQLALPWPDGLSATEAAALPEALFTTWLNVFGILRLAPGEVMLLRGGTGGVGHLAIRVLAALGHRVVATCGDAAKCETARSLGAVAALTHDAADLPCVVRDMTGGRGANALLDCSAGARLSSDLELMAEDGRIAVLSGGDGRPVPLPLGVVLRKRLILGGAQLRPLPLQRKVAIAKRLLIEAWPVLTRARAIVAAALPLDAAAEAHALLDRGSPAGKVMLTLDVPGA